MIRILLDTNAYSAFKRGEKEIIEIIARSDEIFIPIPVLAELRIGFKAGSREKQNIDELEEFLFSPRVFTADICEQTALFYTEIYSALKQKGTPIPINDVWIAACTIENGAILISNDIHFKYVAGLLLNAV